MPRVKNWTPTGRGYFFTDRSGATATTAAPHRNLHGAGGRHHGRRKSPSVAAPSLRSRTHCVTLLQPSPSLSGAGIPSIESGEMFGEPQESDGVRGELQPSSEAR